MHMLFKSQGMLAACVISILFCAGCRTEPMEALGTLEWDQVHGRAVVSEPISEIMVKEGEMVAEGKPILRLDTRLQEAQVAQLVAMVAQSEWELKQKQAGYRQEEIATAVAEAEAAKNTRVTRQMEYDREQALFDRNASSDRRIDLTKNALSEAIAQESALNEQSKMLQSGYRQEEIEQAKAGLAGSKAQLLQAQEQLDRYTVRAERAGRLDSLPFKLGDKPPVGAVVSTVLAGDRPWARVYAPEPWVSQLAAGDTVDILIDGQPKSFSGRVRHVAANAAFTPYYTLSEEDRSRLSYVAEIDLIEEQAQGLPVGVPVRMRLRDKNQK
ncbi:MAG: HlyD family secretion protein [Rubripirellula sp.]